METNDMKLYHEYLIRLDDELSSKLVHFTQENDMKITGVVRRSLRQFFDNEESKSQTDTVKINDQRDE